MNARFHLTLILLFSFGIGSVPADQKKVTSRTHLPRKFTSEFGLFPPPWRYLLHLPGDYDKTSQPWPMILFLHGRSVRGNDLEMVKRYGPPAFLDQKHDFPFVVVSPQLPAHSWPSDSLLKLLDEVIRKYRVDPARIYLTGVSMGGGASWHLAAADQKRFAAMIPLCGYGGTTLVPKLNDLPIWAFHGEIDKVTPLGPHLRLVEAVQKAGGTAKMTVIPEGTHGNIIFPTYQRDDIYEWLLTYSRDRTGRSVRREKAITRSGSAGPDSIPVETGYVVKKGDTLWRISRNHGVSLAKLKQVNSLSSDLLKVGQTLLIPK